MADVVSPSTAVEARSLSSITSIAANPPAYPRNPAQPRLDRIELYIVRVPGSKDVVLTPLKPPTKSNVSIEAINSSLYYLHVATEDDEIVLQSLESDKERRAHEASPQDGSSPSGLPSETVSRLNSFHRKPVGGQEVARDSDHPPPPPPHRDGTSGLGNIDKIQQSTHDNGFPSQAIEKDFALDNTAAHDVNSPATRRRGNSGSSQFTVPRRPVTSSGDSTTSTPTLNTPAMNASHIVQGSSYDGSRALKENISPQQEKSSLSGSFWSDQTKPKFRQMSTNQSPSSSFRITVIRRDTATGNQWNVGTISSSSSDSSAIHIEITNPGYAKFLNSAVLPTAPVGQTAEEVLKVARNILHDDNVGNNVFSRDVVPIKHNHHRHGHSLSDVLLNRSSGPVDTSKLANVVSSKTSRGYFSFQSPWNGTCSFVSSINGGSLKCKHVIANPAMSAGLDGRGHNEDVTVSELRYNTPFPLEQAFRHPSATSLDGNNALPRGKRAALSQLITSNLEKVQQRTRTRSQEERPPSSDEDRLDLSLAKEAAGGGMSGKSAKLGKLIIEDEGIKMIDLVVAASMGVWWRSSYQCSSRN